MKKSKTLLKIVCLSTILASGLGFMSFAQEAVAKIILINNYKNINEPMGTYKYVVNYDGVNVRTGPGTNFRSL